METQDAEISVDEARTARGRPTLKLTVLLTPMRKMTWANLSAVRWSGDMQPDRSGIVIGTYRPGLGAPSTEGGKAEYDTGKKDSIGKKWQEILPKETKQHYDQRSMDREWVGGQPAATSMGNEKTRNTQWMAGNGDGMLV